MSNKAAAILAGTALLIGGLIGRASANTGGAPSTPSPKRGAAQALDPKAYPRTKEGAATAAQAYDDALGRAAFFMTADQRRSVVDTISSTAMLDQIAKDEEQAAEVGAKAFDLAKDQGQLVERAAPLGYRVVSFTADSARVETWTATVFGKPGVGHGVTAQFKTTTIDLAWERSAWRLAGTPQGKDGPTPASDNAEASAAVAVAVRDLQEFTHVAR
jgi:hypothetical protein